MENKNRKYIYIGISIAIVAIVILLVCFFLFQNKQIKYVPLTASDGSFEVKFPSTVSYQSNAKENNEFVIDLYSNQDEMFFYATHISKSRQVDFHQIVTDDKENYLKDKENIREDSGIVSFELSNYKAYEYHFVYYDTSYGKDFYSNVIWIETEKNIYVLNFEVVNDNIEKYQNIFLNIKNSFVEL